MIEEKPCGDQGFSISVSESLNNKGSGILGIQGKVFWIKEKYSLSEIEKTSVLSCEILRSLR